MNLDEIQKLNSAINKVLPGASIQQRKDVFGLILETVKKECDRLTETTKFVTAKDYKLSLGLVQQLTEQAKALAVQNSTLKAELSIYKQAEYTSRSNNRYREYTPYVPNPRSSEGIQGYQGPQGSRTTVASTKLTSQEALKALRSINTADEVKQYINDPSERYCYTDDDYNAPYRSGSSHQSISGYFPTFKTASEKYLAEREEKRNAAAKAIEEANKTYNELPPKQSSETKALASLIYELKKDVVQAKAETISLDDYNLS